MHAWRLIVGPVVCRFSCELTLVYGEFESLVGQ